MFNHSQIQQAIIKGRTEDPSVINIVRVVKNNRKRIERWVHNTDRRVASDHILVKLLSSLRLSKHMSYEDVEWHCRRNLLTVANGIGATNLSSFGKPFVGAFLPDQDEIISVVANSVSERQPWEKRTPARYLYHPHTSVNWEMEKVESRGLSFIEINIVELAWQYVQSLKYYATKDPDKRPNVYVWLYRYVFYRMLPSFFNLAIFNRHYYNAIGQDYPEDKPNKLYPVPDIDGLLNAHVKTVAGFMRSGNPLPATVLNHITLPFLDPMMMHFSGVTFPINIDKRETTWQLRWVYELVNLHFVRFVLSYRSPAMKAFLPTVKRELRAYRSLHITHKMPSHLQSHINKELIKPIENEL